MSRAQKIIRGFIISILLVITQFGMAHADEKSLLSKFQGEWFSSDDAFGQTAKSTMTWSLGLDGQLTRLDYKIEMAKDNKVFVFRGIAYYKSLGNNDCKAFWGDDWRQFNHNVFTIISP